MHEEFLSVGEQVSLIGQLAPNSSALVGDGTHVSFGRLAAAVEVLARRFQSLVVPGPGIIAIASLDAQHTVVAALAAWRIGCAYLPVNASGAPERVRRILNESGVKLVVTDETTGSSLPSGSWQFYRMDGLPEAPQNAESELPLTDAWTLKPSDLAYVIYTSGSTGEPKGVAVTHGNLRHLVNWYDGAFHPTSSDRGIQLSVLTFDAAVLETWPVLAAGASLYVPDRSISLTPLVLRDFLVAQGITLAFVTPAIAEQLISLQWPQETRLRYLLTGGDTLHKFPPRNLPFHLVNNYGPTECTVLATSGIVPSEHAERAMPTIGAPIRGAQVYVLDSDFRPVEDGEKGQICIGGDGVAAGYLGRQDLTSERFTPNPFNPNARMYLTGDLGRKLRNGEIEFCGRMDDQIKIRGHRIEPGEIVAALRSHPSISAAAVVPLGSQASTQLAAYLVINTELAASDLRAHLAARIPCYMIPDHFVRLSELPLTPSGKLDRARVPPPDNSNSLEQSGSLQELENDIEQEVGAIISGLLAGRELGREDNFFRLGGHSLMAAQIVARLRNAFHIELPLRTVFESPTVAALSAQIEKRIVETLAALPRAESEAAAF